MRYIGAGPKPWGSALLRRLAALLALAFWPLFASADESAAKPVRVVTGVFVNGVQDVSFRDSKYAIDFYIWFRWNPGAAPDDFKPLEVFELVNGRIDNKSGMVEKAIGAEQYASARVLATMNEVWALSNFPFDNHRVRVHVENSTFDARRLVFVPDRENSRLGDEIRLSGWKMADFAIAERTQTYKSNYGDVSLPRDAESSYSRLTFSMQMSRDGNGIVFKILTIVIVSTLVAFVAFLVKPTDLDPRFGLGVGAQFAVAASWFIVSSLIPDSAVLTVADQVHILAMATVFASVVVSAWALRLYEGGKEAAADRLDRLCVIAFPAVFLLAVLACVLLAPAQ